MSMIMDVRRLYTRLQDLAGLKRKEKKRIEISAPFNFKKEGTVLPGMPEYEVQLMREKAAASRIGIADEFLSNSPIHTGPPTRIPSRASSMVISSPVSPVSSVKIEFPM